MPTEWEHTLHDLVASIRAVGTALADSAIGPVLNLELGATTYASSPIGAVGIIAAMTEGRLRLRDEALERAGHGPAEFPREELLAGVPTMRRGSRHDVGGDCVDFLKAFVSDDGAAEDHVQGLVDRHGLLAFMRLVHLNNIVGSLVVAVDDRFDSLQDLMADEALADEREWLTWVERG